MFSYFLQLLSRIYSRKRVVSQLDVDPNNFAQLNPLFQHILVGHDSTIVALVMAFCQLKHRNSGGVILLAGKDQKATKQALMQKLSTIWGQMWDETETSPIEINANNFKGQTFDVKFLELNICKEKRTVWVKNVSKKSLILESLEKIVTKLQEKKILCILEATSDTTYSKSEVETQKFKALSVFAFMTLDPDIEELEQAIINKWNKVAGRRRLADADLICAVTALKETATPSMLQQVVDYILRKMDKPQATTLGKHQIEGKNKTDEDSQSPAKKLKADVSTSSSTATNSNTASFAESNSNQMNDDHHDDYRDDHHTQDDHHDDHHKDSSTTENSAGTMDESAITSVSRNNTTLNSGESTSETTIPEIEDIFQTPVPEHFKSFSKRYAEKARQHPVTYDTSTLAGQFREVAKKSFETTKEISQNVTQSAKDISQNVAKDLSPETVDAIGTIASPFIPGAETVLHSVAEVMRKRKKPDDQQDQQK